MPDFLDLQQTTWVLPLLGVGLLFVVWAIYRLLRDRRTPLQKVFDDISFDRIEGLVIPGADEGEIMVDHLLLTSKGPLIIDIKNARGTVFGGDKMQDWTVMSERGRYTFPNPQPALYDRIAAVRQIVRDVPVSGRILFLDGARFTKGVPELVSTLEELAREFGEPDEAAARARMEALMPHWERLNREARDNTVRAR